MIRKLPCRLSDRIFLFSFMSISLNSIDCPCLTNECRKNLLEQYSIDTINDFLFWLNNSTVEKNECLSSHTIECIQSCIIAHTASISPRELSKIRTYRVNSTLFDRENCFRSHRHVLLIYEYFNQYQWNEFFNPFLLRLFLENQSPPIKIKYLNTDINLFDMKYFYHHYCQWNEKIKTHRDHILEKDFFFTQSFDLQTFENELLFLETNSHDIQLLIIDDFFSLIKPYFNLDKRIKNKILQLTYRLNRLAQKQSLLILTGVILNHTKPMNHLEETSLPLDVFHADKYILFQSLSTVGKEIRVRMINEKTNDKQSIIDLDMWRKM